MRTLVSDLSSRPRWSVVLPSVLMLSALLAGISMPFPWHEKESTDGITLLHGYQTASWLIAAAAVALVLAVRFSRWGTGVYGKWVVTVFAFCMSLGMYGDYINAKVNAAAAGGVPYFGAGFYLGVAAAVSVLAALIISWRSSG